MNHRLKQDERWILRLLAVISAITFFFPLISIHVPLAGNQDVSGYNAAARIRQFTHELGTGKGESGQRPSIKLPRTPGEHPSRPSNIPISIRAAWLIPVFIIGAFIGALFTLLGSFVSLGVSKIGSLLGTLCGLFALLHVTVMNSDVHNMLQESMNQNAADLKRSPFAGFAQALGNLVANAFQVKAGVGLYVLFGSMALAAFLAYSRFLSRTRPAGNSL